MINFSRRLHFLKAKERSTHIYRISREEEGELVASASSATSYTQKVEASKKLY